MWQPHISSLTDRMPSGIDNKDSWTNPFQEREDDAGASQELSRVKSIIMKAREHGVLITLRRRRGRIKHISRREMKAKYRNGMKSISRRDKKIIPRNEVKTIPGDTLKTINWR